MTKRFFISILMAGLLTFSSLFGPLVRTAGAVNGDTWDAANIISDSVFTNNGTMTYDQIKAFLASKVPTCDTNGQQLSEYGGPDLNGDGKVQRWEWGQANYNQTTFTCLKDYVENGRDAAEIIYDTARAYNLNPEVLIVLLQKEQGLITDTWPLNIQYKTATGYGCPDTAPCDTQYYGLTNQLDWSGKMFRAILDNSPTWYTPYILGTNYIQYNPDASCGGTNVGIANRSTQALYNYTPYQPNDAAISAPMGTTVTCGAYGNLNFFRYFNSWFGAPRGDYCPTSLSTTKTSVLFGKDDAGGPDLGKFMIDSGSSTGCVEAHTWNMGFGSWKSHVASNSSSVNLADSEIEYADLDGSGKDEPILVSLTKNVSGSGNIEFHVWDSNQQTWKAHYISNAPVIDPTVSRVAFADLDGDGKDEGILLGIAPGGSGSGNIEIHVWNPGFGSWKAHYITNSPVINPAVSQISFADLDGDGKDEGILLGIAPGGSGSGNIEMHVWNPGFGTWKAHYISNAPVIDPAVSQVSFADVDGDGKDEGVLLGLRGAGTGSGNIEMHVWNPGFGTWKAHYISNQPGD